jgi:hypothetical protein
MLPQVTFLVGDAAILLGVEAASSQAASVLGLSGSATA